MTDNKETWVSEKELIDLIMTKERLNKGDCNHMTLPILEDLIAKYPKREKCESEYVVFGMDDSYDVEYEYLK